MMSLRTVREVVLDVETSGFSAKKGDRIIEIGVVAIVNYEPTDEYFYQVVHPRKISLSSKITEITGLTDQDLIGKPRFSMIAKDLLEFIGDSNIVAHNAEFDRDFVNSELYEAYLSKIPEERWICSLKLARSKLILNNYSLDSLCKHFGISLAHRKKHGALIDARLAAQIYSRLRALPEQPELNL